MLSCCIYLLSAHIVNTFSQWRLLITQSWPELLLTRVAAVGLKPLANVIGINSCPGNSSCKIQFNHTWWRTFSLCLFPPGFPKRPKKLIYPSWREKYINNFTSTDWRLYTLWARLQMREYDYNEMMVKNEHIYFGLLCVYCKCHELNRGKCTVQDVLAVTQQ